MSTGNEKLETAEVTDTTEKVKTAETAETIGYAGQKSSLEKEIENEIIQKAKEGNEEAMIINEIIAAQTELNELREQYGLHEEEKGLKKAISNYFDRREAQAEIPINKKKYIWLALLLGWVGGHRFYTKQYTTAIIYLLTCWTGFSISMTIIDLLIVIPKKPDENGNIYFFNKE